MSETQAWLDLMAAARRAEWNGDREATIRAEVARLEDEGIPPVPALRRPALQVVAGADAEVEALRHYIDSPRYALTEDDVRTRRAQGRPYLRAEEIRPGMRLIDGEWFYSARWL